MRRLENLKFDCGSTRIPSHRRSKPHLLTLDSPRPSPVCHLRLHLIHVSFCNSSFMFMPASEIGLIQEWRCATASRVRVFRNVSRQLKRFLRSDCKEGFRLYDGRRISPCLVWAGRSFLLRLRRVILFYIF